MGDDGSLLLGGGESSKKDNQTRFLACLKLPHHDPSPPSLFWIVDPLRA
jgi:hypothetical protein